VRYVDARTGIEMLEREECLALLAQDVIGRLAVLSGVGPVIFPVNYALDGDAIVFRTAPGTKLDAGPRAPASFEIDSFDRETKSGWSVVVVGRLEEATPFDAAVLERVQSLPVEPWAEGDTPHWIRLVPTRITGRRVDHQP
jgi:nitroimidazol reductase NimA-like FMN-containing flavoprotein (pyridoxamine 5'-phosphate oxidase superfamily)